MDCNWCICGCGQQVYDASELYFSPECKNADATSVKNPVTQTNTPPDSPTTQLNLRFSVAIANSTAFHERGGNRGSKQSSFMSPPSSVSSSYSDSNSSITSISTIDHQYHHHRHQRNDSLASVNDEEYCSKSVPINIPTSYSRADDTVMEINKGTFGKDNYI